MSQSTHYDVIIIGTGAVTPPEVTLGFSRGFLVRDPDGHAMQLSARP